VQPSLRNWSVVCSDKAVQKLVESEEASANDRILALMENGLYDAESAFFCGELYSKSISRLFFCAELFHCFMCGTATLQPSLCWRLRGFNPGLLQLCVSASKFNLQGRFHPSML